MSRRWGKGSYSEIPNPRPCTPSSSSPIKNTHKPIHKMPVDADHFRGEPKFPGRPQMTRPRNKPRQRNDSAQQVDGMRRRHRIEKRAAGIRRHIDALRKQLPPRNQLSRDEREPQRERRPQVAREPPRVVRIDPRQLQREAAQHEHDRIRVQNFRQLESAATPASLPSGSSTSRPSSQTVKRSTRSRKISPRGRHPAAQDGASHKSARASRRPSRRHRRREIPARFRRSTVRGFLPACSGCTSGGFGSVAKFNLPFCRPLDYSACSVVLLNLQSTLRSKRSPNLKSKPCLSRRWLQQPGGNGAYSKPGHG